MGVPISIRLDDDGLFAPSCPNAIRRCAPHHPGPLRRHRSYGRERLRQALLGHVASGGDDLEDRLEVTPSRITAEQLAAIRRQIGLAVGDER